MEALQEFVDNTEFPAVDLEYVFLLIPPLLFVLFYYCCPQDAFSRTGSPHSDSSGFAELDTPDTVSFAYRAKNDAASATRKKSPTRAASPKWTKSFSKTASKSVTKPVSKQETKPVSSKPVSQPVTAKATSQSKSPSVKSSKKEEKPVKVQPTKVVKQEKTTVQKVPKPVENKPSTPVVTEETIEVVTIEPKSQPPPPSKPVSQPVNKPVSEPIIKAVIEPVSESVSQQVSQPVSKSPPPVVKKEQLEVSNSTPQTQTSPQRQSRSSQRLTFAPSRERALSPTRAVVPQKKNSGVHEMHIQLTVPPKRKKDEILTRLSSTDGSASPSSPGDKSFVKEKFLDEEELELFENVPSTWKELRISSSIPQQSPQLKWNVSEVDGRNPWTEDSLRLEIERAAQNSKIMRSESTGSSTLSPDDVFINATAMPSQRSLIMQSPKPDTQRSVSVMFLVIESGGRVKELKLGEPDDDANKASEQNNNEPDLNEIEPVWQKRQNSEVRSSLVQQRQDLANSNPMRRLDSGFESLAKSLDERPSPNHLDNGSSEDPALEEDVTPVRKLSATSSRHTGPKKKGRFPWNYDQPIVNAATTTDQQSQPPPQPDVREKTNSNNNNASDSDSLHAMLDDEVQKIWANSVSEHQTIHALLKQANYVPPDSDELLSKAEWPLFSKTKATTRQHLVEEVKLMQHALHKYKLEFRSLEIRARTQYKAQYEHLAQDERAAFEEVCELKTEVNRELGEMERLLSRRMKGIIAGNEISYDNTTDLASMQIINQMIELLKEQVYHGNIVNSMGDLSTVPHPLLVELESVSDDHEQSMAPRSGPSMTLMDQLALLQKQIESQQNQTTSVLNTSMRDLRHVLLEEIRNSIHSETQDLRYQVQAAEAELKTIKRQMSAPSDLRKLGGGGGGGGNRLSFDREADIAEAPYEI